MTLPSVIAATIVIAILAWTIGGPLLRVSGLVLAAAGLLLAAQGSFAGLVVGALGAGLWLAGHALYAARHHAYRSPLARRLFQQLLPPQLDVTRDWGVSVTDATPTHSSSHDTATRR